MSEADAVARVENPVTASRIAADLRDLGVEAGDTLLVHSSLAEFGWVAGGPQAVVDGLQQVLTPEGTLVMPAHSTQYSDPEGWSNPSVPAHWPEQIREGMPPFRPEVTPTRGMGAIPECFRSDPDAERSSHPLYSFTAWGAGCEEIVEDHSFGNGVGEESPLARVYDRDGSVLMLGTDYGTCTSLHLAEYRADYDKTRVEEGAPVLQDGERTWVEWEDLELDDGDFPEVGEAFEAAQSDSVEAGEVGAAPAKLVEQPTLVEFATEWFTANR